MVEKAPVNEAVLGPISNCSWRFIYIKILKYKYTPEEKHINILVTYINNYLKNKNISIITQII